MIIINNQIYNVDVATVINDIHEQIPSILNIIKDTEDNIMVQCPFHKDGKESRPSCGIHKQTGVFNCFMCHETGTLNEFISKCFGRDDGGLYGSQWLRRMYQVVEVEERPELELAYNRKQLKRINYSYVPEMVLEQYRHKHPYMYKRKLTDEVIERFDIGYDVDTDTITFPVRDIYGNCLFVGRRSVKGKYFNYPSGAEKPLYGLYELKNSVYRSTDIWVTESMFNCLTLWTHNIPALALNGTGSWAQIKELANLPYRCIVLALDPDNAGRTATKKIKDYIQKYGKMVYTVDYVDGRDINDLSYEECEQLINSRHLL